jgi:hypothetical protein
MYIITKLTTNSITFLCMAQEVRDLKSPCVSIIQFHPQCISNYYSFVEETPPPAPQNKQNLT